MSSGLTAAEIREIEAFVFREDTEAMSVEQKMDYLTGLGACFGLLLREVHRLRQGLWDCAGIAGADLDGDKSPDVLTYPDIVDYAQQEVQQLRNDYDEALKECAC
jgi:hypothetical protein